MKPDILYRILIWERRKTNKATLILFPVALTGGYNFPITSRDNCVLIFLTKTTHNGGKRLKMFNTSTSRFREKGIIGDHVKKQ